ESYNMAAKAIVPLEAVLPQAPEDAQINQRLASLYARAGRLQDAIKCCNVLHKVYAEAGFSEQAAKYVDMAAKYKGRIESAGKAAAVEYDASFMPGGEIHMPPPAAPAKSAAAASVPAPASGIDVAPPAAAAATAASSSSVAEFSIDVSGDTAGQFSRSALEEAAKQAPPTPAAMDAHEIDLSEWEKMTVEDHAPTAAPPAAAPEVSVADLVEEARFYIGQSLWKEAEQSIAKLKAQAPKTVEIAELQQELGTRKAASAPAPAEAVAA